MRYPRFLAAALAGLLAVPAVQAQELRGAEALLAEITPTPAEQGEAQEATDRFGDYYAALPGLLPEDAAAQWVALLAAPDFQENTDEESQGSSGLDDLQFNHFDALDHDLDVAFREAVRHLPGPDAWPHLPSAISAAQDAEQLSPSQADCLLALASVLLNEPDKTRTRMRAIVDRADEEHAEVYAEASNWLLEQVLQEAIAEENAEEVFRILMERSPQPNQWGETPEFLASPQMLSLLDEPQVRELVRTWLPTGTTMNLRGEAREWAREEALAMLDDLEYAPWWLTLDLESGDLYNTLSERFERMSEEDLYNLPNGWTLQRQQEHADEAEFIRRLLNGDAQGILELQAIILEGSRDRHYSLYNNYFGYEWIPQVRRYNGMDTAFETLYEIVELGHLSWIENLNQAALTLNRQDEVIALLEATLAGGELDTEERFELEQTLFAMQIESAEADEAVQLIREAIDSDTLESGDYILTLAQIALMSEDTELFDEALGHWLEAQEQAALYGGGSQYGARVWVQLLVEAERYTQAEQLLTASLRSNLEQLAQSRRQRYHGNSGTAELLEMLVHLYVAADRPADALRVLETYPWWEVSDLAELSDSTRYQYDYGYVSDNSLTANAATALMRTGRDDEARTILHHAIREQIGNDTLYLLLLELDGQEAVPFLESLTRIDRFEERPLIFLAELARQRGDLADALTLIEQAIAIDPSDGEQGPDDRMRAYQVMADIQADRGDQEKADFFNEVVAAIRLAETADQYLYAGLTARAMELYEESLTRFADAYCIQSRMALQLASVGKMDEAAAYYRRAYELMPSSFGRMESHCFGCEGAFTGEVPQAIAEEVFTRMLEESPENPQLHYLMGYLRDSQERFDEARDFYLRAVELDPDYINAWVNLAHTGNITPEIESRIAENLLRLDPYGRHTRYATLNPADPAIYWAHAANLEPMPQAPESLLPLTASAEAVEALGENDRFHSMMQYEYHGRGDFDPTRPGSGLLNHTAVRAIESVYLAEAMMHILERMGGGSLYGL